MFEGVTPKLKLTREEILVCRNLTRQFGTSYFWATLFLPRQQRHATYVLYAFFRLPDELVDTKFDAASARRALSEWRIKWRLAYSEMTSDEPVLSAASKVFHFYKIPFSYSESFLDAMEQDTGVFTYETYKDLEKYMYGSAAVVGLMMSHVIGFSTPVALSYATALGEAMQLTNFLRDVGEDWSLRRRIYIPQEDMRRFDVTVDDIAKGEMSANMRSLLAFEIGRARALYNSALPGIAFLRPNGRRPVRIAAALYGAILGKIEERNYDVFSGRARTTKLEKFRMIIRIWKEMPSSLERDLVD